MSRQYVISLCPRSGTDKDPVQMVGSGINYLRRNGRQSVRHCKGYCEFFDIESAHEY